MNTNESTSDKDDILEFLETLYFQLFALRSKHMEMKLSGESELKEMGDNIDYVNHSYESLAKSHTIYLRLQKASGKQNKTHSDEVLKKIQEIKANVGQIVSLIPKADQ